MGAVLSIPELVSRLRDLRATGKTIALANGHFDLVHVGHLRYLRAARAEADALVVAINDDDSVARLKGAGRPIMPALERAELLAALEPVDFVVIFEGDSPTPLLELLRPEVHCKGPDYGSPELDLHGEDTTSLLVSPDRKTIYVVLASLEQVHGPHGYPHTGTTPPSSA